MAEEAFALSPVDARPNVPGEADYDAIREAFMETARGRWFLAEYAKRNRTTDTRLVLEAVSRLEANLAAQKQPQTLGLIATLGAIRTAVRQAKASAIEAMPRIETDETLTGARNGARIIREIAWTLRECGADTRICDLLDTQVKAIEAGQQLFKSDGRDDVLASYDVLMQRIEQIVDGDAAQAAAAPAIAAVTDKPTWQAPETREASVTPLFKSQAGGIAAEAPETMVEDMTHAGMTHTGMAPAEVFAPAVVQELATEAVLDAEAEHDLAVLEMVAAEMGALDASGHEAAEPGFAEQESAEAGLVESRPSEPEAIEADLTTLARIAESALAPEPLQPPAESGSLGAALIAHGVIAHPAAPMSDPLAPFRKMTQAEKIAFFS